METYEESVESSKPRRPWMRWLKRIGKGLLVAVIAIVIRQAWHHREVTKKLQETLAEMDRTEPGWRLKDIEAAREPVPEDENSARVVVAAAELLPRGWPPPEFEALFGHLAPEEQLAPDDFARLQQAIDKVRPALVEARKLAKLPRGRHRIAYLRNVMNTQLEDQQRSRQVVHLFLYDALLCDQRQDTKGALNSCQAAFNVARSLGDEPLSISQLVRIAGIVLACRGVERALAQGEVATEDLAGMQKLLADEDAFPDYPILARGERALWHEMFDAMESEDVAIAALSTGRPDWDERLFGFAYRDNIRLQHPTLLAMMNRLIALSQLPMPEQAEAERLLDQELRELRTSSALAALPFVGVLKLGEASRRKHALIRCTLAALAAECYRQKFQTWPASLDQLCPQFLADVPLDPFDGEPLRFRRTEDGIVIYAVGSDGVDNNGNLDREHPTQPGVDIGFRLWNIAKRRQPAHPKPPALNPG